MKAIRYRIDLEQPLLATSLLGDPNSSVSFDFIPGSLIRGMCIQHYLRQHKVHNAAHNPDVQRLFFNGHTRYLHAYPLNTDQHRSLPMPHVLSTPKHGDGTTLYNESHMEWNDTEWSEVTNNGKTELKPVADPFCTVRNDTILRYRPNRTLQIHIQRDRRKGHALRATGRGEIFQYDALAADQSFGGIILCDTDSDADTITTILQSQSVFWLGRSRSAHYGRVRFHVADVDRGTSGREVHTPLRDLPAEEPCTLSLLSDTFLTDAEGNALAGVTAETLKVYLNIDADINPTHTFTTINIHGGFNRTWQLPIPQLYALAAGSTITFTPRQTVSATMVQQWEEDGIGARRAEGFGRLTVNWLTEMHYNSSEGKLHTLAARRVKNDLKPVSQQTAKLMAKRLLEKRIDQEIAHFIETQVNNQVSTATDTDGMPENSQLSRLNNIIRQALSTDTVSLETVQQRFGQFKPTASRKFDSARLEGTSLSRWIDTLLANPQTVWDKLTVTAPDIAGYQTETTNERDLTEKTALRLLSAVLSAPMQRRKDTQNEHMG